MTLELLRMLKCSILEHSKRWKMGIRDRRNVILTRLVELVIRSSNSTVGNVTVSSNKGCGGNEGEGLPSSHFDLM